MELKYLTKQEKILNYSDTYKKHMKLLDDLIKQSTNEIKKDHIPSIKKEIITYYGNKKISLHKFEKIGEIHKELFII